jgi:chromosome segregation ATPase
MRLIRIFLLAPMALCAQTDQRVLETLLSEVQQLRAAIERSTLLGVRTQLAISQLQLQESKTERLSRELQGLRDTTSHLSVQKERLSQGIKQFESKRSLLPSDEIENNLKQLKFELDETTAAEQRETAREAEVAAQLQTAQREVQDSRSRIAEMERTLDSAIQQMLKPR